MIDIKSLIEQETGLRFNRANKICCPLHKEKTPYKRTNEGASKIYTDFTC